MSSRSFLSEHARSLALAVLTVVWVALAWDAFSTAGELTLLVVANVAMAVFTAVGAVHAARDER